MWLLGGNIKAGGVVTGVTVSRKIEEQNKE
jgi:hypothetical protein